MHNISSVCVCVCVWVCLCACILRVSMRVHITETRYSKQYSKKQI